MSDQEVLDRAERAAERVVVPDGRFEDLLRRRDRKRRNRRITAAVVGIGVFLATVWIVRDIASLNRTHTPAIQPAQTPAIRPTPPVSAVGTIPETDYLLDLDTGETTPLPESIAGNRPDPRGSWNGYAASPDGSRLAYTDLGHNGEGQIFVANLDGTGIEQVTHDPKPISSLVWSPDGSKIAYIGEHDHRLRDLFVLDLATGESTQLTFATPDPAAPDLSPWAASSPSFTPDGSSIVYGASREGNLDKYEAETRMVPVTGGESVRLMDGVDGALLSPDGSLLAYAWPTSTSNCVCVSNADGTGERVLVQGGGDAINGTPWSPDGTRIAYFEFHSNDVSIVDVATGQVTHVAEGYRPTWLDDHTLIVEMDHCYDPTIEARVLQGCGG